MEAIHLSCKGLKLVSDEDLTRAAYLGNHGVLLARKYKYTSTNDASALDEAILVCQRPIDSSPIKDLNRATWVCNLGNNLHRRFQLSGHQEDIDEAISAQRRALELMPRDHSYLPDRMANLASVLSARQTRFGGLSDDDKSIRLMRKTVELTPRDMPRRALWLHNLSLDLDKKYEKTGEANVWTSP